MANLSGYNRKLSALMRRHELVGEEELQALGDKAKQEGKSIATLIVEEDYLDEMTLIGLVSEDSGLPPVDLDKYNIDMERLAEFNRGEVGDFSDRGQALRCAAGGGDR